MDNFTFLFINQPFVDAFKSAVTNYFNLPRWFYTSFYFIIYLLLLLFIIIIIIIFAHSHWWETFVNYNI